MESKVGEKLVIFKIYPLLWKKSWECFLVECNEIFERCLLTEHILS